MTIESVQASSAALSPADRVAAIRYAAVQKLKSQVAAQVPRAPTQPAPALRPTIQDRIEIDRALLLMRQGA